MPLDELNNSPLTDPAAPSPANWPPLDRSLLGEARPAPPPFPLHLLPGTWRVWVEAAARPFGSADYLAHCLLGAVAGVCGAGLRISVTEHWREPLLLWQALVGGPSSGKSAAFERVHGLLDTIRPWSDPEEPSGDTAAPAVLVDARLRQLELALRRSSRGVVLWRDDLADWMDEARRRKQRPAWLAAWNAAPSTIDRRALDCLPIGIMGALSPEKLAPGFVDGDSALAARFLYAWPGEAQVPSLTCLGADDEGMVELLQKIADVAGARDAPGNFPLDATAVNRLGGLMAKLRRAAGEAEKAGGGVEAEWIAKGAPTIVRLAAVLTLMQRAEGSRDEWRALDAAHIDAAHELWSGYYLPQARSVFDRSGIAGCEHAARKVARWLRRVRSPEISREDVRRQALCQTVDAQGAEDVLARLEAGGVLRQVPASGSAKGGPRRRRWTVHPQLASWRS